jgi:ATP-dependent Lon protease
LKGQRTFFRERKLSIGGPRELPLLPLKNIVLFPQQGIPLLVGREKSIAALQEAAASTKEVLFVAQRDAKITDPSPEELYTVGTIGNVIQTLNLPDGTIRVFVEGRQRARIVGFIDTDSMYRVEVLELDSILEPDAEVEALVRSVKEAFEQFQNLNKDVAPEGAVDLSGESEPARVADTVASRLNLKLEDQQALLEELMVKVRLERLLKHAQAEIEILQVERKITSRIRKQVERSQKAYYLNERMAAIQKELGEKDEFRNELDELEQRILARKMSDEATERATRELRKLRLMPPMSAEATVVRNYIDAVLSLPWNEFTDDNRDIDLASSILDEDHFGLKSVKSRILEYLAVTTLVDRMKGPILCLVGPPGVGKTSLARSIARATGRKFVRLSLGGVRDEAEIRGHRRTYIGALPGKILHSLVKAGSSNPVFLLDEVDKLSTDFRGDPSSALLEVLDAEQNHTFNDHYLEMDYDLSRVMFICTANSLAAISPPLQDRLEVLRIAGYTENEKLVIAWKYLIPKQREANGLKPENLLISKAAIRTIIRAYTREAGVRGMEREIARICRKCARKVAKEGRDRHLKVTSGNVRKLLGVPRYLENQLQVANEVGIVKGLAVTPWGGDMLDVEVAVVPGKGQLILTGLLGDWLKESATAAFSYIRTRAEQLGLPPDFQEHHDFHVHYPGNAMKTDGPSAGITMATALVSALTGIPVRRDVAMTGEISLRGRVLPIGGLKEKSLAAHRGGIRRILIPADNQKDIEEIPKRIRDSLEIVTVGHMDEVLRQALAIDDPDSLFDGRLKARTEKDQPAGPM